ncbi:HD domain-containing protein [Acholeplasma hippikon]|uniref:3'-5' exoribonuclease yhaM n=1 Tax=Acholeplasma hippikon TaxID=264636 RepID=A0A449BK87_9MOLU|nr:HD domain-containing protein [Acholeplasma hippikon]VEU82885.1 3'-5' exoribonuclease yhaM [Acholeplasma hippikon]
MQQNKVLGKVDSINKGANYANTSLILEDKSRLNVKLDQVDDSILQVGKIYEFELETYLREEVTNYRALAIRPIEDLGLDSDTFNNIQSNFYDFAPLPLSVMKKEIEVFLNKIENKVLFEVTNNIYRKYQNVFYTHPAATKFHHAYVGGLAYHTLTMLKMIEPLVNIYSYLNKDLLYAATLLHDISKINEMTGVDGEYTTEGLLLGHLVMGSIEIEKAALVLGYQDTEEVMLLKHLMIAHHGQLTFGSPKKPQTGEALLLWFIDTMDSKFTELGNELDKVKPGEFTQAIGVLDKMRFYKPKI